jgi:hypothetical protein
MKIKMIQESKKRKIELQKIKNKRKNILNGWNKY